MDKLIAALRRLYLDADSPAPADLERHLRGEVTLAIALAGAGGAEPNEHDRDERKDAAGQARALMIAFPGSSQGWETLCEVANAMQERLGLPAPAVSVGGDGYALWLSLAAALPGTQVRRFLRALHAAYFPGTPWRAKAAAELPPCLHRASGKWAAFINPGMGASFADDCGLEMAPPPAAQAAFLEGLESITGELLARASGLLEEEGEEAAVHSAAVASTAAPALAPGAGAAAAATLAATPLPADSLLLRDATLEDIVRHLHARHIEPTFRHLLRE